MAREANKVYEAFMKKFNLSIFSTLVLSLTMTSCGGTTIEAASNPDVIPSESSSSSLSLSSSVGEYGSLKVSTTTTLYPSGGVAPYTFKVNSGNGTINSSTKVFTAASTAGTVGVRVTDSLGNTADHYFYVVTSVVDSGSGDSNVCVSMASATSAQSGTGLEQVVNLNSDDRTKVAHVMTGIGLRAKSNNLYALYVKSEKLSSDGSVTETPAYATTQYTDDGNGAAVEIFIEAPSGYYIYGVGAATNSTGEDFEVIKIYIAKPNTATETFDTQECVKVRNGALECGATASVPTNIVNYREFTGRSNKPMTAFGAAVNGGQMDRVAAWSRALSFVDCE